MLFRSEMGLTYELSEMGLTYELSEMGLTYGEAQAITKDKTWCKRAIASALCSTGSPKD